MNDNPTKPPPGARRDDDYPSAPRAVDGLENGQVHISVGDKLATEGDLHGALSAYKKAARHAPGSPERLTKLAEGYAAADLPKQAIDCYQKALEAHREQGGEDLPEAHMGVGDLCRSFALSAVAVRSYERAVRSRPRRPFYRWKLSVALAALGLYDKAEQQMLAAVELAPRDAFYRFQLGDVYLLMRDHSAAVGELERAVALAPRDDYYRLRLGAALLRCGRTGEAVSHFEQATRMQPKNSSYRTLLRYAESRDGREPSIAVEVDSVELNAYDGDFVRRIQSLCEPLPD